MDMISALIDRPFSPEVIARHKPNKNTILSLNPLERHKPPARFEDAVFNYLHANRGELGIESLLRFKSLVVDGQAVLSDGRRFAIEVKLNMNWLKACQSGWQIRQFVKRVKDASITPIIGALVFFEEFSGDWDQLLAGGIKRGWRNWYTSHFDIDGVRVHLLQFREGRLEGYPQKAAANSPLQPIWAATLHSD
jgi:hypothetical protein